MPPCGWAPPWDSASAHLEGEVLAHACPSGHPADKPALGHGGPGNHVRTQTFPDQHWVPAGLCDRAKARTPTPPLGARRRNQTSGTISGSGNPPLPRQGQAFTVLVATLAFKTLTSLEHSLFQTFRILSCLPEGAVPVAVGWTSGSRRGPPHSRTHDVPAPRSFLRAKPPGAAAHRPRGVFSRLLPWPRVSRARAGLSPGSRSSPAAGHDAEAKL